MGMRVSRFLEKGLLLEDRMRFWDVDIVFD